jgi:hypothetical protein
MQVKKPDGTVCLMGAPLVANMEETAYEITL